MNAIKILRAASHSVPNEDYVQFMAAVDAVEDLIGASKALQEAMDEPEKGPFDSLTVKRFHEADAKHRAALANVGGAA